MRILADENLPFLLVDALRKRGHDVAWVRHDYPGISDLDVLERASVESRILLTFDKDFGDLVFRDRTRNFPGVILFRVAPQSPDKLATLVPLVLESRTDWHGHFAVVEAHRIRLVSLSDRADDTA